MDFTLTKFKFVFVYIISSYFPVRPILVAIEKLHKLYDVNYVWNMQRVFKIIIPERHVD